MTGTLLLFFHIPTIYCFFQIKSRLISCVLYRIQCKLLCGKQKSFVFKKLNLAEQYRSKTYPSSRFFLFQGNN